jgi:hypothetical protein
MKQIISLILIVFVVALSSCGKEDSLNAFSKQCGIDLTEGTMVSCEDNHGGFQGDGYLLAVVQYTDNSICEEMEENEHWLELPLSENLQTFLYQPYDDTLAIPEIKNGYYYFYDTHSDSKDHYDDSRLLDRSSFNFIVALYDMENHTLYWCEYDT